MAVFVNYYPGSYGDSLVSMFSGEPIQRYQGRVQRDSQFKFLDFYSKSAEQRNQILQDLGADEIISCHRQQGIDLGHQHRVISVIMQDQSWFPKRVKNLHIIGNQKNLAGPWSSSNHLTDEQKIWLDYTHWKKYNVLHSDIMLPFSTVTSEDQMQQFCQSLDLRFDLEYLRDIRQDIMAYQ